DRTREAARTGLQGRDRRSRQRERRHERAGDGARSREATGRESRRQCARRSRSARDRLQARDEFRACRHECNGPVPDRDDPLPRARGTAREAGSLRRGRRRGSRDLPSRGARVMPATDKGAATQRPPLVLVAEDATIVRLDLCRMLVERAGFPEVVEARDGEEAVALAREHRPDIAILDVNMPKLDGIEAARAILADRPLPVVMLTAYADEA